MAACDPDQSVEICSSAADPVFVQPIAGGAGGLTDAELRATPVPVSLSPVTSGGSLLYRNLDLGVTGQVVKASAGQLYGYFISNNGTGTRYIKIYNKATAPTQADTPVATYVLQAGMGANVAFPNGVAFSAGISLRATTGLADNDTGAPTTNDVIVNLNYK